mmetsp:Transcript_24114/g.66852  ORF Transcript_24114/g.66852 Transcript_24114/m.66852 type:complete len:112 (+) Transcript_24114:85-420(+)
MRLSFLLVACSIPAKEALAFAPSQAVAIERTRIPSQGSSRTEFLSSSKDDIDCGCAPTVFSGKPSDIARDVNPRQAICTESIFSLESEEIQMDDLLGKSPVSIVVLLRSLG